MYRCAECSATVAVVDGQVIRICGHDSAAVVAEARVEMRGKGGVS